MKRGPDSEFGGKRSEGGKSELTVLAEKFKEQFCREADIAKDVNLNSVADILQVSRRRLYDIVNVLEALQMVSRSGKLTYRWEGIAHLPRLLAMLYSDAIAGAERGQSNPAFLEGRMPGSCWALTRRIVQQLLIDRSQVPLTLLVQRLESALTPGPGDTAPAAAAAATSGCKTSLATVERRIYDIGSVLSTFDLVSKTLQGGSGPRHRQPVYQWLLDWESQLPAETLHAVYQEAANAAAAASAAPDSVPHPEDGGAAAAATGRDTRLQQHQSYNLPPTSVSAAQQQQQPTLAALNNQQQPQGHDQHALGLQQHSSSTAATALQQRFQQLNQLVNSVLVQHGEKTCVTMSQLKDLLQQVQAGEPPQQKPAAANSVRQQQMHASDPTDSSSKDTYQEDQEHDDEEHDDQEQLDAAECLQQLRAGGASAQQPGSQQQYCDVHQQQRCGRRHAHEDASTVSEQRCHKKQRRSCLSDAPESSDQCCPGMTCFDLGAALRAAAFDGDSGQQGQLQTANQQDQQQCPSACAAQDAEVCGSLHAGPSNDAIDEQALDYAEFAAIEGDEAPGARVGSNTLNNSREGISFQELAAAAVASLQLHQQQGQQQQSPHVEAASDLAKAASGKHAGSSLAAAAGGVHPQLASQRHSQQQLELQAEEPWLHSSAHQSAAAGCKGACAPQPEDALQWLLPLLQTVQGTQAEHTTQLETQVLLGSPAAAESQVQHPQLRPWWTDQSQQQQQQHGAAAEHLELSQLLHAFSASQPACAVSPQQQKGPAHNQSSQHLPMAAHMDGCDRDNSAVRNSAAGTVHAGAVKPLHSHGKFQSSAAGAEQDWLFSLLRQHHVGLAAAPAMAAEALVGGDAAALAQSVLASGGLTQP